MGWKKRQVRGYETTPEEKCVEWKEKEKKKKRKKWREGNELKKKERKEKKAKLHRGKCEAKKVTVWKEEQKGEGGRKSKESGRRFTVVFVLQGREGKK